MVVRASKKIVAKGLDRAAKTSPTIILGALDLTSTVDLEVLVEE